MDDARDAYDQLMATAPPAAGARGRDPVPPSPAAVALDAQVAALAARLGLCTASQRLGAYYLLGALAKDTLVRNPRQRAYVLATAWHETAHTFQPVREIGQGRGRPYGKPGHLGQIPYGRGYVQLTWEANYATADHKLKLGGRLIANYDLALQPNIAYRILARGMAEGWFTGRRLDDYLGGAQCDFVGARRIVNGTDRADIIASHARACWRALVGQP